MEGEKIEGKKEREKIEGKKEGKNLFLKLDKFSNISHINTVRRI
jgi:hypothetical protein